MTYTLRIAFALSLLIAVAMPHSLLAQTNPSFTAGCYTRNADGSPNTLVGQPTNGACPTDSTGNSTYAFGANGLPGTAGSGNLKYVLLEPLSVTQSAPEDFCGVLSLLFKLLIYFGGMLAVLYLVLGGIGFMVSEVANKRTVARQRIQGALWGLAILLSSWVILNTLNPKLINACNLLAPYQANGIVGSTPTPGGVSIKNDTLTTGDGNAAITRQQTAGSSGQTLETLQAAGAQLKELQNFCTATLGGTLPPIGYKETSSGCAGDDDLHYYGNTSYKYCKKIPIPSSSSNVQLCLYNPPQ